MDIASSSSWGTEACARLCKMIVQSNSGISQMITENKTDLLDLATVEELQLPDIDSGLSAVFMAIYYDRPDVVKYLHRRGVDLSKSCDPMGFATPFFYIVSFSRFELLGLLDQLGYSLEVPCDTFRRTPLTRAIKINDTSMRDEIIRLINRRHDALNLLTRDSLRFLHRTRYRRIKKAVLILQKIVRAYWGRKAAKVLRKAKKKALKEGKLLDKKTRNKMVE